MQRKEASPDRHAALIQFLESAPWATILSSAEWELVARSARYRFVAKHQALFHAGDASEYWYGVIDGLLVQVIVSEGGQSAQLATAQRRTWFGEGTLLRSERWRYDCIALRATQVAAIPAATFDSLRQTSIPFNHYLQNLLNARLAFYVGLLGAERTQDPDVRMAKLIASFFQPDLHSPADMMLKLTQAELGSMAGMSRQRANLALRRLQEKGLIEIRSAGDIRVVSVGGLSSLTSIEDRDSFTR